MGRDYFGLSWYHWPIIFLWGFATWLRDPSGGLIVTLAGLAGSITGAFFFTLLLSRLWRYTVGKVFSRSEEAAPN